MNVESYKERSLDVSAGPTKGRHALTPPSQGLSGRSQSDKEPLEVAVLLLCLLTLRSGCWSGPGVYSSSWCCSQTQQVWRSCITCAAWTGCSRHEDTEHSPSLLLPLWSHLCRWDRICHLSVWAVHRAVGSRALDVSSDDIRAALESHGVFGRGEVTAVGGWLDVTHCCICSFLHMVTVQLHMRVWRVCGKFSHL